jgi:3-hydroxyisobutyrate dehydrogenase-like beta-hydroxyacid dehydrogenase
MAANLARAGHGITLWNRWEDEPSNFPAEIGARVARKPRALVDYAQVVVNILANDAASDPAHRGPDWMFARRTRDPWMVETVL